jgi:hypothetical protein
MPFRVAQAQKQTHFYRSTWKIVARPKASMQPHSEPTGIERKAVSSRGIE